MTAPTWQRELDNFIGIKPVFVIEGNIADISPWEPEAMRSTADEQAVDAGRGSARSSAATETAQWAVSPSEDCLSTAPLPPGCPRTSSKAAFLKDPCSAGLFSCIGEKRC